jgi:hypothetical protein
MSFTLSSLEPATFRLAAECLNHYATAFPPHGLGYRALIPSRDPGFRLIATLSRPFLVSTHTPALWAQKALSLPFSVGIVWSCTSVCSFAFRGSLQLVTRFVLKVSRVPLYSCSALDSVNREKWLRKLHNMSSATPSVTNKYISQGP